MYIYVYICIYVHVYVYIFMYICVCFSLTHTLSLHVIFLKLLTLAIETSGIELAFHNIHIKRDAIKCKTVDVVRNLS